MGDPERPDVGIRSHEPTWVLAMVCHPSGSLPPRESGSRSPYLRHVQPGPGVGGAGDAALLGATRNRHIGPTDRGVRCRPSSGSWSACFLRCCNRRRRRLVRTMAESSGALAPGYWPLDGQSSGWFAAYAAHHPLLVCLLVRSHLRYSSAIAATSSRQKSGRSGTTRPQTRWEVAENLKIRLRRSTPTVSRRPCHLQAGVPAGMNRRVLRFHSPPLFVADLFVCSHEGPCADGTVLSTSLTNPPFSADAASSTYRSADAAWPAPPPRPGARARGAARSAA